MLSPVGAMLMALVLLCGVCESRPWGQETANATVKAELKVARNRIRSNATAKAELKAARNALRFDNNLAALKEFKAREGHTNVPRDTIESGIALGKWVSAVQQAKRSGKMSDERVSSLESAGMAWTSDISSFQQGVKLLSVFSASQGHSDVPKHFVVDGVRLFAWLHQQTRRAREGSLSDAERDALVAAGVDAARLDTRENLRDGVWGEALAALHRFAAREDHSNVPRSHAEPAPMTGGAPVQLGAWLVTQQVQAARGELSDARRSALGEAGVALREAR